MAESEEQVPQQVEDVDEDDAVAKAAENYKAPAQKSIAEILDQDKDDESLRKYKEQLLGTQGNQEQVFWPDDPRRVILKKMSVCVEGRPNEEINLEDQDKLKNTKFVVKEGVKYRIMMTFNVQREIVAGLRLVNKVSRGPVSVKTNYMVGSYGPKKEVYEFKSPEEEFPSGMLQRGDYKVKSCFTDDDKNELLAWEWQFTIKKDWKD